MPSVEDWRTTPLQEINRLFKLEVKRREENPNQEHVWTEQIPKVFSDKLETLPDFRKYIPSLNVTPNHELVDGQLVRFRCMIQDMFDPEFYFSEYKIKDLSTGSIRSACGRFRDFADLGPRDEVVSGTEVNAQRDMFYCISVPGETPWAQDGYKKNAPNTAIASGSNPCLVKKRRLEDDEENCTSAANVESMDVTESVAPTNSGSPHGKKSKATTSDASKPETTSSLMSLNLPIPGAKGQAAIVKLYDVPEGSFALNDVVEFVGVVSLNPMLVHVPLEGNDVFTQFEQKEMASKNPPASLVPRLHALKYFKLQHNNPLLPLEVDLANRAAIKEEAAACRADLHGMLTKMLLGDTLAADYMICHLISRIYLRRDVLCLGKFSLNLFNVPMSNNYSKRLSTIIQLLMTKSHYLPGTIENLNKLAFVPRKDYHENRLVSGLLQLSNGTQLILDETQMENGQLTADGVKNVTAIGNLISWQKLEYNFNYHHIEFESDVPCLVISEGRSMFPNDAQVMHKPVAATTAEQIDQELAAVSAGLNAEFLDRIRRYLTVVRLMDYDLNEDVQKAVQEDFVNERRERVAMTTDDLHAHLVLARLVGTSRGDFSLNRTVWEETKSMERMRRERVAHLPVQRQPQAQARLVN